MVISTSPVTSLMATVALPPVTVAVPAVAPVAETVMVVALPEEPPVRLISTLPPALDILTGSDIRGYIGHTLVHGDSHLIVAALHSGVLSRHGKGLAVGVVVRVHFVEVAGQAFRETLSFSLW